MDRKEIAKDFLQLAGSGKVQEAFDKYVSQDFVHHNAHTKAGRQALIHGMSEAPPLSKFDIKHVYQDGNTVITHSQVSMQEMNIAVIHILRFEGNKLVEFWDLGHVMDAKCPNEDGLF